VLILDMGEPVRILDVAQRMIAMSGKDIDIVFTGLRPGEKMHEDLMGEGENDSRPLHPKISHTTVAPLDPQQLSLQAWKSEGGFGQGRRGIGPGTGTAGEVTAGTGDPPTATVPVVRSHVGRPA
jgi:hypothetical protein